MTSADMDRAPLDPHPGASRWALRRSALGAFAAGALAFATPYALAAPYLLQPGDRIRIDIDGVPRAEVVATINADGALDHSRLGSITAAGLSIADLRARIADRLADTSIAIVTADGERRSLLVERADVRVDIEALRPVVVAGLVRNPGDIAWTPGLTARRAIALAGGFASPAGGVADLAGLRATLDRLFVERAAARLALWRVDALAQNAGDVVPPATDPAVARMDATAAGRLVDVAMERLRIAAEARRLARSQLHGRIAMLQDQHQSLLGLIVNYEEAVADDEREYEAVRTLFDRGVASRDRLSDVRRATMLSSTRLLEARADEAAMALEIEAARQALETLHVKESEEDGSSRAEALADLLDVAARLGAAQTAWDMAIGGGVDTDGSTLTLRIETAGGTTAPATFDATLSPGDLVEVVASGAP